MSAALEPPLATRLPAAGPQPRFRRRSTRLLSRVLISLALFVILAAFRLADYYPPLPQPFTFDLVLAPGSAGRSDPLIVAGETGTGDFLTVRFEDERTVHFVYDSWGMPGVRSQSLAVQPGAPLRLTVTMPALDQVAGGTAPYSSRLRVDGNGTTLVDTPVPFYVREAGRIFLGENPLGGTACGPTLHGELRRVDGRVLRGSAAHVFTGRERIADWLTRMPWQPVLLLVGSIVLAFAGDRLAQLPRFFRRLASVALRHRWFAGSAAVCVIAYAWLVTLGSFQLNHGEVFGVFYDYQAASFLQGRLDVPESAIGGEAFEARGKLYGYFGPTPALLRLPFVVSGFAFGKLSRAFMLLYFLGSLIAAYLILREAVRATRATSSPPGEDVVPSAFATVVLTFSTGLGSTLFFLGSRGLIFHEAILGGITFGLWACWCALRHLRAPTGRWWIGALVCGTLSIHTRPPTGLFALTFLGCIALVLAARQWRRQPRWHALRRPFAIGVLCAAGVLSLNGLAWLKFRTFDAAPLRISRPYTEPGRLERIDGKSFHLVNIPYNVDAYLLFPNFRLERGFPWIYLVSDEPRRGFPRAKIDLPDHTLALPYAMPSLFGLATLGCLAAVILDRGSRAAIGALWAAALPMSLALFAAIATAQRYTGDFCPFLICAAAFGLAGLELLPRALRVAARAAAALATVAAVAVTAAITLHYQGATLWGVPEDVRQNYQQLRQRVDAWFR